jgi:type IV fimbrial biogenesis protein FimT
MRRLTAAAPQRGLTLIEVMIAVLIASLLLTFGVPMFNDYSTNARLREAGNTLLAEANFAQSEAIKRNGNVRLTLDGSTLRSIDRTSGADVVLREHTLPGQVAAAAALTADFGSDGRPLPFGTALAVNLAMPGTTCSGETRCPGLRIDAGGGVRLCGNYQSGCD